MFLLLLFTQCKKDNNAACATCSLPCVTGTVYNGYMCGTTVTTSSFCGNSQSVSNWEANLRAQYPSSGGYCVSFTSAASQTKQVCGSDSSVAIATYTTAGYTCN